MAASNYHQMYINGQWVDAIGGQRLAVVNPATEETIAEVPWGGRADTAKAIDAAYAAMPAWSRLTAWDRSKILKKAGELLRERVETYARILTQEQGKPLAEAKAEVMHSADTFEWFAEEGKRAYGQIIPPAVAGKRHMTLKHPVGVVGGIGPWNFPITQHVRKIAPALAAGCTIVCKPADPTPLSLINVFHCLIDAGVPAGVVNFVIGPGEEIGAEFMENPKMRKISFTGSTRVGKILMKQAADQVKRLSLELGGHAPLIVFPDADPEVVAKAAVAGKFRNNGQVCISPSRFYVHKDIQKKFLEVAVEAAKAIKQGNGLDADTQLGPMIAKRALETTGNLIGDATAKGAKLLTGGRKSAKFDKGYFFEPTILSELSADARLLTDEPFAPVMPVMDFSKIDDVIAAANNTKYGLAAYVFTNDLTVSWKLAEGLEAGIIGINDPVPATPQCPFGGMKESGIGRELAHEGLEAYLETKFISIRLRD
ncbi:NAD-dependent succinate-semialdehyde dehydrogenase [Telmatocola sphagniphila]|uniref:NAD-dependent succinate-semialdehyde dehydrogenase n=1 Tax=Telmatocola sphagniphila TaxID=1123043 RepID=A0A8E6B329_9BACT|nr:NAD-dependent succinate-semialdehyde dehydrogenase [Telmatocola sphagniphila]QVL30399.1 NAD-dependent succinate-semialdehyde dehydrogenase [Telmatocola sphagniphila]